ncbi:DUF4142 domain-containing protein [Nemorincola caseinilytica]|uniref:DUF4142 domain-containing protein n=2 Tax=Nemorincola caseinilytica TaxID=2054315 RepID=A0ABP8NLI7_9BACT
MIWLGSCKDADTPAEEHNEQAFNNTDMERDADFVMKAATASMAEIELGNLAMANGALPEVKQFGQTMVTDHTAANEELRAAAQPKNIALPVAPTDAQLKKAEELRGKTGADFDKDYIDLMVKDHKDVIDAFEKEAEKGNDPDLKTWAGAKLPALRHHLQMAEELQQRLKK